MVWVQPLRVLIMSLPLSSCPLRRLTLALANISGDKVRINLRMRDITLSLSPTSLCLKLSQSLYSTPVAWHETLTALLVLLAATVYDTDNVDANSCSSGALIENELQCNEAAVNLGASYYGTGFWISFPKGCIVNTDSSNRIVALNMVTPGAAHIGWGPVCLESGTGSQTFLQQ